MGERLQGAIALACGWAFTMVYWPIAVAFYVVCPRALRDRWLHGTIRRFGRVGLWILGIELVFDNASTLEDRRARVVIMNHQSALDLVWGAAIAPPAPLVIGKRELVWVPFVNLAWWALGFVFIDRQNPRAALRKLARLSSRLASEQRSLLMAPEGTRSPDGRILPFKRGAFRTAQAARVPIYPVVVCGAYELLPKQRILPRRGTIRLRYLAPVPTDDWTDEDLERHAEEVHRVMEAAYAELKARSFPGPRPTTRSSG